MRSDKFKDLQNILRGYSSILIAYSGGVDSTFLLKVAGDVLGDKVLAVIARSGIYTEEESDFAVKFCRDNNIRYKVIQINELQDESFLSNPPERCYFCKRELFSKLIGIAKDEGFNVVADGSNVSDDGDFRPGAKAKDELGVKSPLNEAGITKDGIRNLSKNLGLLTWDKPSSACLASRVPYGTRITGDILKRIETGERYLRALGLKQVRVRHHGNLARIEVEKEKLLDVIGNGVADEIDRKFKELGYVYITLDIKGYRTGSMNEALSIGQEIN